MSKQHTPALRNIYGCKTHLQVRVIRISNGQKSEFGKCFSIEKFQGVNNALAEAEKLRDRLVEQHPPYSGIRGGNSKPTTLPKTKSKYLTEFAKGTNLYITRYMRKHGVTERAARRHLNSLMAGIAT